MLAGFGNWDKVMSGEERLEGISVFSNGDGNRDRDEAEKSGLLQS